MDAMLEARVAALRSSYTASLDRYEALVASSRVMLGIANARLLQSATLTRRASPRHLHAGSQIDHYRNPALRRFVSAGVDCDDGNSD